jgi:hypothetical protein
VHNYFSKHCDSGCKFIGYYKLLIVVHEHKFFTTSLQRVVRLSKKVLQTLNKRRRELTTRIMLE